MTLSWCGRGMQ